MSKRSEYFTEVNDIRKLSQLNLSLDSIAKPLNSD